MSTRSEIDARFTAVHLAGWFRWALGVFTAVLVSLIIVSSTVTANSRDGCVRASERANAVANNWEAAAAIRRKEGDIQTANVYLRNVLEIRKTISMPTGWRGHLANRGKSPRDRQSGCNDAYPRLIPFVG
jgi:hypothetical protein